LAKCTTDAVKVVAVGAGVNLVLNFAMIPLFGLQGAISASILAYALCLVYGYYLGSANFKLIIPWGDLLKIVFASGTMLLVMGYTPNLNAILSIVLKILIGVLVYLAMVVALNVGDVRSQLNVLRSLMVARYRREVVS
jgi:O-antigen/teichoic acid export membrane protein